MHRALDWPRHFGNGTFPSSRGPPPGALAAEAPTPEIALEFPGGIRAGSPSRTTGEQRTFPVAFLGCRAAPQRQELSSKDNYPPRESTSMNGTYSVPHPKNEPVRSYAPGTSERDSIKARLATMAADQIEIPLIIGGQEIRTRKDYGRGHASPALPRPLPPATAVGQTRSNRRSKPPPTPTGSGPLCVGRTALRSS